jgi:1-deoxy-D-xylulose-5-phosphate synthase
MVLDRINSPADVKSLGSKDLAVLCAELREAIVDHVKASPSGGHLGSNLGVVELTLALHRVFDSPNDILLWDTGHQAYVHKMITGRRDDFESLREAGGLSGYPCREESDHDWIENSHASTILSYAHGMATAEAADNGKRRRVVAVIGDGSLTGGMAFEGLNNLGHSGSDAIVVLNDNGRSYAPTVSRLGDSLAKIRSNPVYMRRQARIEAATEEIPVVGDRAKRALEAWKASVREMWQPPAFFENLGVRYLGPFDGHDIPALERALRNAAQFSGPTVVHVLTQKGRGYAPAENDPIKNLHDMGRPDKSGTYTAAFTEALIKEGESRPELVAITAAMPDSTGLLPFADRFPDRCIDVGIAEQHAVTAAAGMAMGGLRPVVAVYSTFLSRAFDQLNLDVGLHEQPVVFCLDRAGVTGSDGPSHHGILDMVLATKVPGMTVLAPSSYEEVGEMLHLALEIDDGPVVIRWSKSMPPENPTGEVGTGIQARKVRTGADVALLGVGNMLVAANEAADLLAAEGIEATVWDVRAVKPLDPTMIADAAGHPLVITIEDGLADGGAGSAVRSAVADLGLNGPTPPVRVMGVPTTYLAHGSHSAIHAELGLTGEGVADEARRWLANRS